MGLYKKALEFSSAGGSFGLIAGSLLGAAIAGQRYRGWGALAGGALGTLGGGYGVGAMLPSGNGQNEAAKQRIQKAVEEAIAAERAARKAAEPTLGQQLQKVPGKLKRLWNRTSNAIQPYVDDAYINGPRKLKEAWKVTQDAIQPYVDDAYTGTSQFLREADEAIRDSVKTSYNDFKKWQEDQAKERQKLYESIRK